MMETIDDIVREMRKRFEPYAKSDSNDARYVAYLGYAEFADRIEKAVTNCNHLETVDIESRCIYGEVKEPTCDKSSQVGNEPMTLDGAIAHAEEAVNDTPCGREHKQLADWLKELREIKNGNAAKIREALVQCELFLGNVSRHGHPTLNPGDKCTACDGADELREMVARALSDPLRNCDLYATPKEAGEAFISESCKNPCGNCTVSDECHNPLIHECGINWLFAEAKGGVK
jgi:hypothetical protein